MIKILIYISGSSLKHHCVLIVIIFTSSRRDVLMFHSFLGLKKAHENVPGRWIRSSSGLQKARAECEGRGWGSVHLTPKRQTKYLLLPLPWPLKLNSLLYTWETTEKGVSECSLVVINTWQFWVWTVTWDMWRTGPRVLMSSPSQFLIGSVKICNSRSFFFLTSWHWAWTHKQKQSKRQKCAEIQWDIPCCLLAGVIIHKDYQAMCVCVFMCLTARLLKDIIEVWRSALSGCWSWNQNNVTIKHEHEETIPTENTISWLVRLSQLIFIWGLLNNISRLLSPYNMSEILANLHVSLQFFEQGRVSLQSRERFTQTGGQGQDPWTGRPLWLHVLSQLLTVIHTHAQR